MDRETRKKVLDYTRALEGLPPAGSTDIGDRLRELKILSDIVAADLRKLTDDANRARCNEEDRINLLTHAMRVQTERIDTLFESLRSSKQRRTRKK